ncbi:hypothetical protein Pogu_1965 [Pyrobaculum oguniense TE7]|uniref:Uncharacterized protein n=1 Tax=Pyrobaculum oguniense (strain DSM 13380 / JCM 10595 / TE7) TaxID=698757 RepID=H6QCM4_PYROT|nr:hypothetical protein Pogu_1965 [Pyrobaculum oguniense TE7]
MEVQSSMLAEDLYHNGNKMHREEVVPKLASGEAVGAFTLSEPCCGLVNFQSLAVAQVSSL